MVSTRRARVFGSYATYLVAAPSFPTSSSITNHALWGVWPGCERPLPAKVLHTTPIFVAGAPHIGSVCPLRRDVTGRQTGL